MTENSLPPVGKNRLRDLSRLRMRGQREQDAPLALLGSQDDNNSLNSLPLAKHEVPAVRQTPADLTAGGRGNSAPSLLEIARKHILPIVEKRISTEEARTASRGMLARRITIVLNEWLSATGQELTLIDQRNMITFLINATVERAGGAGSSAVTPATPYTPPATASGKPVAETIPASAIGTVNATVMNAKARVQSTLLNRIDTVAAATLPRPELAEQLQVVITEILAEQQLRLNRQEKDELVELLLNDMLGLGPLEPLIRDHDISDILVNGPNQVYVEKGGKMQLTNVKFRDNTHLLNIATRIVSQVGRRIDESQPMCDARLADGSRVNVIIPPLALDGASMSIRKFGNKGLTLAKMAESNSLSPQMAKLLEIAGACRINIIVSGGTGAGKTTLLNALSQNISPEERVVTVEDSAELRLQQPHVVRLETRPANLEGDGEVTIRDLIKNALRMRPDRVIVGECRSSEVIDMLQAMNTGHDGSMSTIHANNPRTCLTRLENMLNMSGFNMPEKVIRSMISSAVELIVQVQRMRDGKRRVTHIMEIVGMEDNVILCQDLFWWKFRDETPDGLLIGDYACAGVMPHFAKKAAYFGREQELLDAMRVLN
jgi:pilus assembly protein CpaF